MIIGIVSAVLLLLQVLLVVRALLDWSVVLVGPSSAGSLRSRLIDGVTSVTEPILAPVRKVIPPLRLGGMSIDLAFLVVLIAVVFLRGVIA